MGAGERREAAELAPHGLLFLQGGAPGRTRPPRRPHAVPCSPVAAGAEPGRLPGTRNLCSEPSRESHQPPRPGTAGASGRPPPPAGPGPEGAGSWHAWLGPGWCCGHLHKAGLQAARGRGTAAREESRGPAAAGQEPVPGAGTALPWEGAPVSRVREGEETWQGAQEAQGAVETAQRWLEAWEGPGPCGVSSRKEGAGSGHPGERKRVTELRGWEERRPGEAWERSVGGGEGCVAIAAQSDQRMSLPGPDALLCIRAAAIRCDS